MSEKPERIAKILARAGVGSRREVERMIADGRVALDGRILESPALTLTSVEGVTVDGAPVASPQASRLWLYHKPFGLVTTHADPQGRPTVFQNLPADLPRVISIGRLDQNTEGLLLLTNDGELARKLELPATGLLRRYRVRVRGDVNENALADLGRGVTIEGVHYGTIDARIDRGAGRPAPGETRLALSIREGKNREVRNLMRHLGLSVLQLRRVGFGPFELRDLGEGQVQEVPRGEILKLLSET